MSGPYCKTCKHFWEMPFTDAGECWDKSKIIYGGGGNRVNSEHEVWPRFTCDNHTTNTELQPDTVRISRECALEALHAMQNDQARPDFQCGELNEAIGQLKQALEKGE